ncbi:hypothetical protein [Metallosphaera hakonensis]|uniref:hypothetical protein n=1 Tax=Metallosphaera hakonensis TaxID=79601 RepID=UPI002092B3E8|nr:hypothetical protein [Metallosphaera hakonensis]
MLTRTGFHWIHDLDPEVSYEPDTIVSKAEITLDGQSVSVTDTVDLAYPILIRKVKLTGGVFFAWDLHINGVEYGDTALYDPSTLSVIHYKRDKWFLFSCGVAPYQYATGYKETGSYLGTWKDCEDGALSNNPIAQAQWTPQFRLRLETRLRVGWLQDAVTETLWLSMNTSWRGVETEFSIEPGNIGKPG